MSPEGSVAWPGAAARRESEPPELTGSGSATRVRTPSGEGGSATRVRTGKTGGSATRVRTPPGTPFPCTPFWFTAFIFPQGRVWEGPENADSEAAQIGRDDTLTSP